MHLTATMTGNPHGTTLILNSTLPQQLPHTQLFAPQNLESTWGLSWWELPWGRGGFLGERGGILGIRILWGVDCPVTTGADACARLHSNILLQLKVLHCPGRYNILIKAKVNGIIWAGEMAVCLRHHPWIVAMPQKQTSICKHRTLAFHVTDPAPDNISKEQMKSTKLCQRYDCLH